LWASTARPLSSFDCTGTLIVELPQDVAQVHALATDSSGQEEEAAIQIPRIAGAIGSQASTRRTFSCSRR
jgi:hypothetical protein